MKRQHSTLLTGQAAVDHTIKHTQFISYLVMTAAGHLNILKAEAYESVCVQHESNRHDLNESASLGPPKESAPQSNERSLSGHLSTHVYYSLCFGLKTFLVQAIIIMFNLISILILT